MVVCGGGGGSCDFVRERQCILTLARGFETENEGEITKPINTEVAVVVHYYLSIHPSTHPSISFSPQSRA